MQDKTTLPKEQADARPKQRTQQAVNVAPQGLDEESRQAGVILLEEMKRSLVMLDLLLNQKVFAKIREDGEPVYHASEIKGEKAA
jgi:hypothetical protein